MINHQFRSQLLPVRKPLDNIKEILRKKRRMLFFCIWRADKADINFILYMFQISRFAKNKYILPFWYLDEQMNNSIYINLV